MTLPKIDRFLLGLIAAMSLHAFDDVAIVTMLPEVTRQLGGKSWYGASFFAYLLASLISLVWAGSQTDRIGPRKPFVIGLCIFIFGLIVGALSVNMYQFVLGRALQGLGGGCIQAVVFSAINIRYSGKQRKRAISLLASAWILPALLAPMIAGYVTEAFDWHWVFYGMIPLALLILFFTQNQLQSLSKNVTGENIESGPNQFVTVTRIVTGIGLFLATLNWLGVSWYSLVLIPISIMMFLSPLLSIFPKGFISAKPGLCAALVVKGLLIYACLGSEAFLPAYLASGYDYSPFEAGSVITSGAAAWILATFFYEHKGDSFPLRTLLLSGTAILAAGLLLVLYVLTVLKLPYLAYPGWAFVCLGMGLSYSIAIDQAMKYTEKGSEGSTATGAGMIDALGFSFASGFGGAILNYTGTLSWSFQESIQLIWIINLFVAIVAFMVVARRFN